MKILPARKINGKLALPGDKSISHRVAMIAALASGVSEIYNFSTAQDCASTLNCLRQLGVTIEERQDKIIIEGRQSLSSPDAPLDCGNSGSTIRMLAGVLAGENLTATLIGDESLSSRPMNRIIGPLEMMGAKIGSNNGKPPLTITGNARPSPISYELPVASAQVKSAILFASLKARGMTQVVENSKSRDHTERLFNGFGVPVLTDGRTVTIDGPQRFTGGPMRIPGDISSAAYFVAAAMLLAGSDLRIEEVGLNPTRARFLTVLSSWGAKIAVINSLEERNEPVGSVVVTGRNPDSPTSGDRVLSQAMIPSLIDELPLLAVVGTQISGGITIRDAAELRLKESDRLRATAQNLRTMGAAVEELNDGLNVVGPAQLKGAEIRSYGDHRIAMAFSIAALIADGPSEIDDTDCVNISFPEFFPLLDSIVTR